MDTAMSKVLLSRAYLLYELQTEELRKIENTSSVFDVLKFFHKFSTFVFLIDKMIYGGTVSFCETLVEIGDMVKEGYGVSLVRFWGFIEAIYLANKLDQTQMKFLESFAKDTGTVDNFNILKSRED